MKKTGTILMIALLIGTSCTDYLQEDNRSSITVDEYYATTEGYEALVSASYSTMRELYTDMNFDNSSQKNYCSLQGLTLLGTDLFTIAKKADQNDILDGYFLLTPDHSAVAKVFANCYKSIQIHNLALAWAENTEEFEALPVRVAEVRFIRAYMYHLLLELYGGVSIVTEAFDEPIVSFDRDSEQDVFAFIIEELLDIIDVLPDQQQDVGRVTKGAANHLLAAVYLSRGHADYAESDDFANAEKYATDVIESGNYILLSEFEQVFQVGNEINDEIIFSIQFDQASLIEGVAGHNWPSTFGLHASTDPGWPYRSGQIRPTDRCWLQYHPDDMRYDATFMTTQYDPYYDKYDKSKPEDEKVITHVYPHVSIRKDPQNPAPPNWYFLSDYTVYVPDSEEWEDSDFPWISKFDDPTAVTQYDHSRDIFIFRLAETYLLRAEAKIMQEKSGDEDIYAVRSRSWDVMPVDATIDTILDARGRELLGEGKRWMDLRRTGKLINRVSVYNPTVRNYYLDGYKPFGEKNGKAYRRPIPTDVIIRDQGEYGQNVGY